MKINSLTPRNATPVKSSETRVSNAGRGVEASTRVNISQSATLMNKTSEEGVIDMGKVREIAQAIRDGKFQINAGAIADKLLRDTEELL